MKIELAFKFIKKNIAQNIFYVVIQFITTMMVFVLSNMMNNPYYNTLSMDSFLMFNIEGQALSGNNFSTITLLMFGAIVYSVILNYYANKIFYDNNANEIITCLLMGYSENDASNILLMEYAILAFPTMIIATLFSYFFVVPYIDGLIYGLFNVVGIESQIFREAIPFFVGVVLSNIVLFMMVHKQKIASISVSEMMNSQTHAGNTSKKKINEVLWVIVYSIFYVFGLVYYLFINKGDFLGTLIFGLIGSIGVATTVIPFIVSFIKKKFPSGSRYIVLSNYVVDLKDSTISVIMLLFSVMCVVILISNVTTSISYILACLTLGALNVMICITIFSQFFLSIKKRVVVYDGLHIIGINRVSLLKYSAKEVILYFLTLILVPGLYAFVVIFLAINKGLLIAKYGYLCLAIFVLPLLLTMLITVVCFLVKLNRELNKREL